MLRRLVTHFFFYSFFSFPYTRRTRRRPRTENK
jgi:hypothetical protein